MVPRYPRNNSRNGRSSGRRNESSFGSLNGWAVQLGRSNSTLNNRKPW